MKVKTCGDCPWAINRNSEYPTCRAAGFSVRRDSPVCPVRRRFEALRDEIRQLLGKFKFRV